MSKLYFRYSAMNAGKSTALMQVAYNYEKHHRKILIFVSTIDDRHGSGIITSRLGPQRKAHPFNGDFDFCEYLSTRSILNDEISHDEHNRIMRNAHRNANEAHISCILIDEAQFLTINQVIQLHQVAHLMNIPVICYGIRSDFLGNPFPGAARLLALADSIEELKTICACGKKATMNVRVDTTGHRVTIGEQIAIEGATTYSQVCGTCFYYPRVPICFARLL